MRVNLLWFCLLKNLLSLSGGGDGLVRAFYRVRKGAFDCLWLETRERPPSFSPSPPLLVFVEFGSFNFVDLVHGHDGELFANNIQTIYAYNSCGSLIFYYLPIFAFIFLENICHFLFPSFASMTWLVRVVLSKVNLFQFIHAKPCFLPRNAFSPQDARPLFLAFLITQASLLIKILYLVRVAWNLWINTQLYLLVATVGINEQRLLGH